MITKRITVQKGFRLPEAMVNDLERVSISTGRSQNELVEMAIGEFIRENVIYPIENEIIQLVNIFYNQGFSKLFGDLLVCFKHYNEDTIEYSNIEFYQLDEITLDRLEIRAVEVIEKTENTLERCKIASEICRDDKAIIDRLHIVLVSYNFKTPMMQEWINRNFSY